MLSEEMIDDLLAALDNRYTPEELIELLGVTNDDVFDKFFDKIVEKDWSEIL